MTSTEFNSLIKEITQEMNFKRIYDEYYPYIVKYTGYLYRGKNIENDVAQDIFTYILTHENMPYVENPKAWIRTLCKNVGLKLINNDLPLQDGYDYKQDIIKRRALHNRTKISVSVYAQRNCAKNRAFVYGGFKGAQQNFEKTQKIIV